MDATELVLRGIGAFYALAGFVGTRAALTSWVVDGALAALAARSRMRTETARTGWLLATSLLVLSGGLALALLLDVAIWLFLAAWLAQAAYLLVLAPRFFDAVEAPDAAGRRRSVNAFALFTAATALVAWASAGDALHSWRETGPVPLAVAVIVLAAQLAWTARILLPSRARSSRAKEAEAVEVADPDDLDPAEPMHEARRIKVMAEYDCHPLWAIDDGVYGDIPPDALDISEDLVRDLIGWGHAYDSALDRNDPTRRPWSDADYAAHEAEGRRLALRLARELPAREIYVHVTGTGAVRIRGEETA